jgi:hypothetical protein
MGPPYVAFLDRLCDDDFDGAVADWRTYCQSNGKCNHDAPSDESYPFIFCANMLHACLLGKSMGGNDTEKKAYHVQAQKLKRWILENE